MKWWLGVLLLVYSSANAEPRASAQDLLDWNFRPTDLTYLEAGGGELRLNQRSEWLPAVFSQALLTALNQVLSESYLPRFEDGEIVSGGVATEGVNPFDLYHAHIACRKPNAFHFSRDPHYEIEDELNENGPFVYEILASPDVMEQITERSILKDRLSGEVLDEFLVSGECSEWALVFHSFEYNRDDRVFAHQDPRRNFWISADPSLSDFAQVIHFTPGGMVSDWKNQFNDILQIGFLIDRVGEVHIVAGGILELSTVVGRVMTRSDIGNYPFL